MMEVLVVVAAMVAVTVLPVMVGARVVGAEHRGFGAALLAVVLLGLLSAVVDHFVDGEVLAFVATTLGGMLILAGTLGTTLLRALVVSVVIVAVQFAVALLLVAGVSGVALGAG